MTVTALRYQVVFRVGTELTSPQQMVDVQIFAPSTVLVTPAIALLRSPFSNASATEIRVKQRH
jgi:hypothetical protein